MFTDDFQKKLLQPWMVGVFRCDHGGVQEDICQAGDGIYLDDKGFACLRRIKIMYGVRGDDTNVARLHNAVIHAQGAGQFAGKDIYDFGLLVKMRNIPDVGMLNQKRM